MLTPPQVLRIYMTQGNALPLYIQIGQCCSQYDLTGATVWFTVKRFTTDLDGQAIIQKVFPASLAIPDASSGMIRIYLDSNDTINLPPWYYDYAFDLQIKDAQNNIITVFVGTLGIYPAYTKSKTTS
jgi:hypothetical protein